MQIGVRTAVLIVSVLTAGASLHAAASRAVEARYSNDGSRRAAALLLPVRRIEFVFRAAGKDNYEVAVAPGVGHARWSKDRSFSPVLVQRLSEWLGNNVAGTHRGSREAAAKE